MAIKIELTIDDRGVVQGVKRVENALNDIGEKGAKKAKGDIESLTSALHKLSNFIIGGSLAYGAKRIGQEFFNTAMSFERMKITLDTLTNGGGEVWFNRLNQWALEMPLNTQAAVDGFIRLRAMGLYPTIEQMTTLVDVTSALGGRSDTFDGIILAMGQIQSKGKLMAQEIRQLAERGIEAYEILRNKLGLTADDIEATNRRVITSQEALNALWEGMQEKYGGLSKDIMEKGAGAVELLKSNWIEFQRLVMDSGPYEIAIAGVRGVNAVVGEMNEGMKLTASKKEAEAWLKERGVLPHTNMMDAMAGAGNVYNEKQLEIAIHMIEVERQLNIERQDSAEKAEQQAKLDRDAAQAEEQRLKTLQSERYQRMQLTSDFGEWFADWQMTTDTEEADAAVAAASKHFDDLVKEEERFQADLRAIRYRGMELRAEAIEDEYDRQRALAKIRFEEEFGELEQTNAIRIQAAQNLADELLNIDNDEYDALRKAHEDTLREMENRMMSFVNTWANLIDRIVTSSASGFDNVRKTFESMIQSMAIRASVAGLFNLATGGIAGGFSGGVSAYLANQFGFANGGYTGDGNPNDIAGFIHRKEYAIPANVVSYYGRDYFDRIVSGNPTTNNTMNIVVNMPNGEPVSQMDVYRMAELINEARAKRLIA